MLLVTPKTMLMREIVHIESTLKLSPKLKRYPDVPEGLPVGPTLKILKSLHGKRDLRAEHIKEVLGKWFTAVICDNCRKEANRTIVFECTEVPNEGGPFAFCEECLAAALTMVRGDT
jgi:hypothetical protein